MNITNRVSYPEVISQKLETVREYVEPILKEGRPYDLKHTGAVVWYAGLIAEGEGLNPLVLIPAARFHDTGYADVGLSAEEGISYEAIHGKKADHAIMSERYFRRFISENPGLYTDDEVELIAHLVLVHDLLADGDNRPQNMYEAAILEADTLGILDARLVSPTFPAVRAKRYLYDNLLLNRWPRFMTTTGKKLFPDALFAFKAYFWP